MIVVDAGVLAALTMDSPHSAMARQAFLKDPDWAAPPLWRSDLRGALWRAVSAGRLTAEQALAAFAAAETVIAGNEPEPSLTHTLSLARLHNLEMYDAEYVAVAHELGVAFVTTDAELSGVDGAVTLHAFQGGT
ncbi:MAG: type II toxin-antitoxin system VapC family toxin [Gemmatimonadota bacterium]